MMNWTPFFASRVPELVICTRHTTLSKGMPSINHSHQNWRKKKGCFKESPLQEQQDRLLLEPWLAVKVRLKLRHTFTAEQGPIRADAPSRARRVVVGLDSPVPLYVGDWGWPCFFVFFFVALGMVVSNRWEVWGKGSCVNWHKHEEYSPFHLDSPQTAPSAHTIPFSKKCVYVSVSVFRNSFFDVFDKVSLGYPISWKTVVSQYLYLGSKTRVSQYFYSWILSWVYLCSALFSGIFVYACVFLCRQKQTCGKWAASRGPSFIGRIAARRGLV